MKKNSPTLEGFTLVEILVSVGILSILISGIYAVLNLGSMVHRDDLGLLDLQQAARLAMDGMTRELRQGKVADIVITTPGPSSGGVIRFKIPTSTYCFRYSLSGNQIIREILNCVSLTQLKQQVLANDITSLNFSLAANTVEIKISAKKTVKNRDLCFPAPCETPAKTLTQKVWLRN